MSDEQRLLAERWVQRVEGDDSIGGDVEADVVRMNFSAPPDTQWRFIAAALDCAKSDAALVHLAAGPVQYLLRNHGDQFIARVEEEARRSPKFARMLTAAWEHQLSPQVGTRIAAIQAREKQAGNRVEL
jgi:hypothetical protein